ncbi:MAG: DUF1937 family protein [Candidatus Marinimicrobia bacterium]|nr:DUF1937 family protein [Candidatus Neomarinimicrobiota bacterium]
MYIYVCSPYSPPPLASMNAEQTYAHMTKNFEKVQAYMADRVRKDDKVVRYSPIMHWHEAAMTFNLGSANSDWVLHNRTMLRNAKHLEVLQLDGWNNSKGIKEEMQWAAEFDKKVYLIETSL